MRLLFCDTFSQDPPDGSVNTSWSAIEFPSPVVLEEIHVIPRGIRIHEQLSAEGQCGKTSPGQFRIDFFACDVKNESASTFENLCALEFNQTSRTVALPRIPFVLSKLLCSGWYSAATLAIFGADASDINAVRLIHERRENETRARALLPTPQDGFSQNPDERRLAPYIGSEPHSFPNPLTQPPHQAISVPSSGANYRSFSQDKSGPSYGEQGNYQSNRPYRGRQNDNLQFHGNRPRDNYYNNKPPLLPTPGGSNDRRSGRYPYDRFMQNDPAFQNQDISEWVGDSYSRYRSDGDKYPQDEDGKKKSDCFPEDENSNQKDDQDEDDWEDAEYEEISDEEILDEEAAANMEAMVAEDMLLPSSMMSFNPFHMELYPLTYYRSPDVPKYEVLRNKLHVQQENEIEDGEATGVKPSMLKSEDSQKLLKIINSALKLCPVKHIVKSEMNTNLPAIAAGKESEWVSCLEQMAPLISMGLPYLELRSDHDYSYILSKWTVTALQLDGAVANLIGVNVRAVKVGLTLAKNLCETAYDVTEQLAKVSVIDYLMAILHTHHIASSVKISTIHALDAITNWPIQMHDFLFGEAYDHKGMKKSNYARLVELALEPQAARVASAISQLLRKAHVYECMHEVQMMTHIIVTEKMPDEYAYVSDEENNEDDEEDFNEDVDMVVMSSASGGEEDDETSMTVSEQSNIELRLIQDKMKRKMSTETSAHHADDGNAIEQHHEYSDGNFTNDEPVILPVESVISMCDVTISDYELTKIAGCLNEISSAFLNPKDAIGQLPVRAFPLSKRHISHKAEMDDSEVANGLYRMCEGTGLLSSIQALLTLPVVSGHKLLFEACSRFLEQMMTTKSGLLHLVNNSDSVIHMIHHLMKSSPNLDVESPGTAGHLGVKLAFHIQTMQSIDHICSLLESDVEEEDIEEELAHAFKTLYSLTYPSFGKHYVARLLSMEDHLKPILACLWFPCKLTSPDPVQETDKDSDKNSEKYADKKTSSDAEKSADEGSENKDEKKLEALHHRTAVNGYAGSVLYLLMEKSENVSYIYKHLSDITRSCLSDVHIMSRSDDLKCYLAPLNKDLSGGKSDIGKLVGYIKDESSTIDWTTLSADGPGICTALRLLCHICNTSINHGRATDAESRLLVLELFSVEAFTVLLSLADQLHKCLHYFCHGIRPMAAGLLASTHTLIASMSQNIFSLLHLMLFHLLESSIESKTVNGMQITQAIVPLFADIYILLRPSDSPLLHDVTEKVVSVLSLFFEHVSCSDQSGAIISEIIKFAEKQCDNFVPTLVLLSQLLPMPLPIITPSHPPVDARTAAVASCKKWSTCLSTHVENLTSLLLPLSSSTCRPVIEVVVMVIQQIIDLAPSLALTLVKKYINDISPLLVSTVIGNEDNEVEANIDDNNTDKELMLSPEQITSIQTFAEILTLPTAKAAAISILHSDGDGILDLWTYALNPQTPKEDVAAVLLLASVLVHPDLSLQPQTDDSQSLANCFPSANHLKSIVSLAVAQITNSSACAYSRALLVLATLLKTKFAIPYVRNALKKTESQLYDAVKQVCETFDSTNSHSVDAVFNLLETIFLLIDPLHDSAINDDVKFSLSKGELKTLLHWTSQTEQHPIIELEAKLDKLYVKENGFDDIGYALDRMTSLRQSLQIVETADEVPGLEEQDLPEPTPLLEQFAEREIFTHGCEDTSLYTRLSIVSPPTMTSYNLDSDDHRVVQCDLIATAEKFCPGYDLAAQLNKLAKAIDVEQGEESEAMATRRQKMETYSARLGKSLTFIKRSHGLLVTQSRMGRGRGRGRGRGNPSNRPFDLFRHRKQNTSRPPSMHVDDFVAADEEQHKIESEASYFKSPPPPPAPLLRRPQVQSFKREFTPRGGRGGRISRNTGFRPRGGFYQGTGANTTPLNKFRPSTGNRGRSQERYRGISTTRISSRLSFSPREGFKTNKQEQGTWAGFNRDYSSGTSSFRGRGSKISKGPRGGHSFTSPGNKPWGASSFQRRGRGYSKSRGKHMRSYTR